MRYSINVTANDIKRGEQNDCEKCAVARAVRRKRGLEGVMVGRGFLYLMNRQTLATHTIARLPDNVRHWINRFDDRNSQLMRVAQPIKFTLELDMDNIPPEETWGYDDES